MTRFVFLPLGGAGEIGMNLNVYGVGPERDRKWLIVDLGITFAGEENLPGIDLIFPDVSFLEEERKNIEGIVLTHAHEDHFGAVIELWPRLRVPVFATPFTKALLEAKLAETRDAPNIDLRTVALGSRFDAGPFNVELVTVAHSIPEPNALIIRTSEGTVVHTGDWKLDPEPITGKPTDSDKLAAIGADGGITLVCDSTNAIRDGVSPSEGEVARTLAEVIGKAEKRVAVTIFASNVARIKSVVEAARQSDREVVPVGRAMHRVIGVARDTGFLEDGVVFRTEDDFRMLSPQNVLLLATGSQGEPQAAMARIARNDHPRIHLDKGDLTIFSSRTIPGNEKSVLGVQNGLVELGVEIMTDREALVHVSGHPRRDELRQMYGWIKPKTAIPVHGEAMHMHAHAALAREEGVSTVITVKNGDLVALDGDPAIVDQVRAGRLYKDGSILIPSNDTAIKERRKLAHTGAIFLSVVMDQRGNVVADPELSMVGLPEEAPEAPPFDDIIFDQVDSILDSLPRARRRDPDLVAESLRRGIVSALRQAWDKKPVCEVHVAQIGD